MSSFVLKDVSHFTRVSAILSNVGWVSIPYDRRKIALSATAMMFGYWLQNRNTEAAEKYTLKELEVGGEPAIELSISTKDPEVAAAFEEGLVYVEGILRAMSACYGGAAT